MPTVLPDTWKKRISRGANGPVTVHVVDDEPAMRAAIARRLESLDCTIRQHGDAETLLDAIAPGSNEGLVLDLRLPGMSGIQLLSELRSRRAVVPTVILSGQWEVESIVRAIQGGALDFLTKPISIEQLERSLEQLIHRASAFRAERILASEYEACEATLTPRERDVYELMQNARTPKQIAAELGLKFRTAHIHTASVLAKFDIESTQELTILRARLRSGPLATAAATNSERAPNPDR